MKVRYSVIRFVGDSGGGQVVTNDLGGVVSQREHDRPGGLVLYSGSHPLGTRFEGYL